jgi:predicted trehalose synthase
VLVLALAGCTQSPEDQLKTELQTVTSWAATARMASEQLLKGAVPRPYVAQTLLAAEETIWEEAQTIQGVKADGAAAAGLQTSLLGHTQSVGRAVAQMRVALAGGDDQALGQLLEQLKGEEQAVKSLAGGARP